MHACNDSITAYNSWGCGGAVSPPVEPGHSPGGGPGGGAPGSSWDYTIYEALKWLRLRPPPDKYFLFFCLYKTVKCVCHDYILERNFAPNKVGGPWPPRPPGFAGHDSYCFCRAFKNSAAFCKFPVPIFLSSMIKIPSF